MVGQELIYLYLEVQALGLLFYLAFKFARKSTQAHKLFPEANTNLKLLLSGWSLSFAVPLAYWAFDELLPMLYWKDLIWQEVQKYPSLTVASLTKQPAAYLNEHVLSTGQIIHGKLIPDFQAILLFVFSVLVAAALLQLYRFYTAHKKLAVWIQEQHQLRSIGKVNIYITDEERSPFSYRSFANAFIVFPQSQIVNLKDFRMSLKHEATHLRERHHLWATIFWIPRILAPWNPIWCCWQAELSDWHEFACDELVCRKPSIDRRDYGRCLLRAGKQHRATLTVEALDRLALSYADPKTLRQRLERITMDGKIKNNITLYLLVFAFVFAIGSLTALRVSASSPKRLTEAELQSLVDKSDLPFLVPVSGNRVLLERVNGYLNSSRHRRFLREAIGRLQNDQNLVESILQEGQVPVDFAAVAIMESGFRNLPPEANPVRAAGHWQFIVSTARKMGLRVNSQVDERRHLEKATRAAVRYLKQINSLYESWPHSLISYNIGEFRLARIIMRNGERDPWRLLNNGALPNEYLATVVAGMLFWKNPDLLN